MCRDEYKKQKFSLVKKSIFLLFYFAPVSSFSNFHFHFHFTVPCVKPSEKFFITSEEAVAQG